MAKAGTATRKPAAKKPRAKKAALTVARLRELLTYDALTGTFFWKVRRNAQAVPGAVAGCRHGEGYTSIRIDGRLYLAHRLAWLYAHGGWPSDQLDHINGIRSDNRIANLRECSNASNCQNVHAHRDSTSRHVGVCFIEKQTKLPWLAQICVGGQQRRIGSFSTEAEAVRARVEAKRKFHSFEPSQVVA